MRKNKAALALDVLAMVTSCSSILPVGILFGNELLLATSLMFTMRKRKVRCILLFENDSSLILSNVMLEETDAACFHSWSRLMMMTMMTIHSK